MLVGISTGTFRPPKLSLSDLVRSRPNIRPPKWSFQHPHPRLRTTTSAVEVELLPPPRSKTATSAVRSARTSVTGFATGVRRGEVVDRGELQASEPPSIV
jgi:hypothetical protein